MTTAQFISSSIVPAALSLLPAEMDSPEARAMLLAIGLQESRFEHRRQIGGPARGFWQFEHAGVIGVVKSQWAHLEPAMSVLSCHPEDDAMTALEHNDVLACVFARLLLWTVPARLPTRTESAAAYLQYIQSWRPGKPRPTEWGPNFTEAWRLVETT